MAGDTSVDTSTSRLIDASIPRHAQPRVAEGEGPANTKAAPAKRTVSSGISGLDAAVDEKVGAYLQADEELPGKLARIDESALQPNKKTAEKCDAIISVAQLHQEAVDVANHNVPKQAMDTPLGHAIYTESHVKQLGEELDKAKKSGAAPDVNLTRNYNEAVSNNLARWRVALRNALAVQGPRLDPDNPLFKSCKAGLRRAEELASKQLNPRQLEDATKLELVGISEELDKAKRWLAEDKRDGKTGKFWSDRVKGLERERSDLVSGKIAPGLHQSPLELAKAARDELMTKSRELDDAKAALAAKSDSETRRTLSNYVKVLENEYKTVVIGNFGAALGAANYAAYLEPPNEAMHDAASRNYQEALGLLRDVAPELEPMR